MKSLLTLLALILSAFAMADMKSTPQKAEDPGTFRSFSPENERRLDQIEKQEQMQEVQREEMEEAPPKIDVKERERNQDINTINQSE